MHRAAQPLVGAAAADIGEIGVDVGVARIGIAPEVRRRRHDLAGLAVAALRHLLSEPGLLHRMPAVRRQTFDGGDLGAVEAADGHGAGSHRLPVDMYRAGAALGDAAAVFGSGEPDLLTQHPQQRSLVLDIEPMRGPVDLDGDHDVVPMRRVPPTRPVGAEPDRSRNTNFSMEMRDSLGTRSSTARRGAKADRAGWEPA